MLDTLKSIFAGFVATPFILIFTIGIGLASGLNIHFLLFSILVTNIIGILLDRKSSYFYNVVPGIVVFMFMYNQSVEIESGYLQTFIIFLVPALFFTVLSLLPIKYPLIPNRVVAILSFGIGIVLIIKQLPNAFDYNSILQSDTAFANEERSFLAASTISNWIQLSLALLIPTIALIGLRFKKGHVALLLATFGGILIGYLLGFDTTPVNTSNLIFNKPFKLEWNYSPDVLFLSLSNGITLTVIMLISFWSDFSMLEHDQLKNKVSINKSLQVVGVGNLISGLFGVMPTNVSLIDSYIIRVFGGNKWVSKLPIIFIFILIAYINIPEFNIPIFAFSGVFIFIGILLLIKTWKILKELHWIDYIFTFLIGLIILLIDFTSGFIVAMIYALIYMLIIKWKNKNTKSEKVNEQDYD